MEASVFAEFQQLIQHRLGINLANSKTSMLTSRLTTRLSEVESSNAGDYLKLLKTSPDDSLEWSIFTDIITTNFTSFFRTPIHFEEMKKDILKKVENGKRHLTIWSAASSTGQEPYSIAMAVAELELPSWVDVRILATDVSQKVLVNARKGVYHVDDLKGVSLERRQKFFTSLSRDNFEVNRPLREMIHYSHLNLTKIPYPMTGPFDFVFCRNVMIYFDANLQQKIIGNIEKIIAKGGMLFIGSSEGLVGVQTSLQRGNSSCYRNLL